jgi:hypothetical protein
MLFQESTAPWRQIEWRWTTYIGRTIGQVMVCITAYVCVHVVLFRVCYKKNGERKRQSNYFSFRKDFVFPSVHLCFGLKMNLHDDSKKQKDEPAWWFSKTKRWTCMFQYHRTNRSTRTHLPPPTWTRFQYVTDLKTAGAVRTPPVSKYKMF